MAVTYSICSKGEHLNICYIKKGREIYKFRAWVYPFEPKVVLSIICLESSEFSSQPYGIFS